MTANNLIDWDAWYKRYSLDADMLHELRQLFPIILGHRQLQQFGLSEQLLAVPLSTHLMHSLLTTEPDEPDMAGSFEHYLEQGELQAALVLVNQVAKQREIPPGALNRRLSQRQQELELEFGRLQARLMRGHQDLVQAGVLAHDDHATNRDMVMSETLGLLKRFGPALELLSRRVAHLDTLVIQTRAEIETQIINLRVGAQAEPSDSVRAGLLQLVSEAEQLLQTNKLGLAQGAILRARVLQESRDTSLWRERPTQAEDFLFRKRFPNVRAREIMDYLEGRSGTTTTEMRQFLDEWCPDDWRQGRRPSRETDPTYPIFEALKDLTRLSGLGTSYPFSNRDPDSWRFFLRSLFTLMGKRGLAPESASDISVRSTKSTPPVGFWLGRCHRDLSIPFTFLDPARLTLGLPVIMWHRPNDPLCPKPDNLQNDLHARGLTNSVLLFIAGDQIYPEDRHALHRAIPTSALLDERDLLEIIFCSDRPDVRAMHFARAVAWQLPADQASPFREQGDVASAMFVGRKDVLRELLAPDGPTVLYGGRKLGKSSIFRQVERTFETQGAQPDHNIAIYFNAINVVDGEGIERQILPNIVRQLDEALRPAAARGEAPPLDILLGARPLLQCDDFENHIRRVLSALPNHRVLLLVDEADSLLQYLDTPNDAAISPKKRFGWTLRALVQESAGRFDVRFAGFQEISRAAQSTSGPFYNFRRGTSLRALSVLKSEEARQLVVLPLQLLRVNFADESLVELILDFTGRHPALIQEFCRRIYERIRETRSHDAALVITQDDVEAVWQQPDFRKSVVRAVHLNVETRNTRQEKILRLLLYLWVRQIMAPNGYPAIPTVCQAADLYGVLRRTFGEETVERQVRLADLDNYLSDLATLGVLEKFSRGYAFRYRYFASLLFHDFFGGQLSDSDIEDLWTSIVKHEDQPPRLPIRAGDDLSLSPFPREEQARMELEQERVVFVLGAPGTGKTSFFNWLKKDQAEQLRRAETVRIIDAADLPFERLREQLANALSIRPQPSSWQALADEAVERWSRRTDTTLVVLENVNYLSQEPAWPLAFWPAEDKIKDSQGLVDGLAAIIRATSGRLRFALTGAFQLARLWVEAESMFVDSAAIFTTQCLTPRERDAWFETAKLVATPDTKQRLWRLTGGDWRLLRALRLWFSQRASEELEEQHVREFGRLLEQGVRADAFPELHQVLSCHDNQARALLHGLGELARTLDINEADEDMWADLLVDFWHGKAETPYAKLLRRDWLVELRAALLLQELVAKSAGESGRGIIEVPVSRLWFQLIARSHE